MPYTAKTIADSIREDVLTLWDYNQMHHELHPCDVGISLGSHDPNVATQAAKLFLNGFFPLIVLSGANAETTKGRFPRGEAQHYQEMAPGRQVWPGVRVACTSAPLWLDDYVASIGSAKLVVDMLVGDTQRVIEYPRRGFAIPQDIPNDVLEAYDRLVEQGFRSRLLQVT